VKSWDPGGPDVIRLRARDDEEGGSSVLVRAVPTLGAPSVGAVRRAEGLPAHDDRSGSGRVPLEHASIDGVLAGDGPRVQALGVAAKTVLEVGARPGDEPVEGHRDVADDDGHDDAGPARRPD
jgi:hypothetical protein